MIDQPTAVATAATSLARLDAWFVRNRASIAAATAGVLVFAARYGFPALDPSHIDWLLVTGDLGQHLLGWLFFRNEPWGFPLGELNGLAHPLGTTVGFTDSIPWVAVLLKPLSPLLPTNFQYIGPWMAISLALMGATTAWILRRMGASEITQFLGGAFMVVTPNALARMAMAHEALAAHWLVILPLGLNLIPLRSSVEARRALVAACALVAIAAGVHPVHWAFTVTLGLALCARVALDRTAGWKWPLAGGAAIAAHSGAFLFAFGYIGTGTPHGGGGFGHFSADLLAFFNPEGWNGVQWSRWLKPLPRGGGQYEGFAFLGLGGIVLVVLGIAAAASRLSALRDLLPGRIPAIVVSIGLWIFALSHHVTWRGKAVLDLQKLYEPIQGLTEAYRSSGRFTWALYYLLLIGALGAIVWRWRARPAVAALTIGFVLAVQTLDLNLGDGRISRQGARWATYVTPQWEKLAEGREHLVLYPPSLFDGARGGCPGREAHGDHRRWAYLAYRMGLTFNGGYVARLDVDEALAYCSALDRAVRAGNLEPDALYVVSPRHIADFQHEGIHCQSQQGFYGCVAAARPTPASTF